MYIFKDGYGDNYVPDDDDDNYIIKDGEDIGWLGYYISKNTKLQELHFCTAIYADAFYKEMSCNTSIQQLNFMGVGSELDGKMFRMLNPFFKGNNSLIEFSVTECEFGADSARQLSLAISGFNKSLKCVSLTYNDMEGRLADIITALSIHPQLDELDLIGMSIGRSECTALSTLLRCTTTQLQILNLRDNNIDDEGVEVLVNAANGLQELDLSYNRITIQGWKAVSTLLEGPDSKLKTLNIANNDVGDEAALVFANALVNNSALKTLNLKSCSISAEGWSPFSKLLCDASSIINTYNSNHTLAYLGDTEGSMKHTFIPEFLRLNKETPNKGKVAMTKILHRHSHLDMQPFFKLEFKVLPIMIEWFAKASTWVPHYAEEINELRLSVIYDFIKEFPMLYIEPVTRREIAECTVLEEELMNQSSEDDKEVRLEEIRRHKARAMRRLQ